VLAPFLAAVAVAAAPGASDLSTPVASARSGAVAYLRAEGARAMLFVVRDGRTTRIGPAASEGPAAQWSPDGRRLAYRDGQSRLVVRPLSGAGRVIEKLPFVGSFAWSPQGDRIAYVVRSTAGAELYVIRADGRERRRLTYDADLLALAWSTDGRSLAYTAVTAEGFSDLLEDLRVVSAAGGPSILFISIGSRRTTCCFAWSPAGPLVYAISDKVAGAARSPVPYITREPSRGDPGTPLLPAGYPVAYSPQGRLLVQRGERVVVLGPRGGTLASFAGSSPTWSPAGDRIAFHRGGRILVARADGTRPRIAARGGNAAWAGPGALAFHRAGCAGGVYVVALGGEPRRVAAPAC
jgi:hypothetical protein